LRRSLAVEQGEIPAMSLSFLVGAVIVTVIGNMVVLRYLLTRPLDLED
jgi:hypothetical protein